MTMTGTKHVGRTIRVREAQTEKTWTGVVSEWDDGDHSYLVKRNDNGLSVWVYPKEIANSGGMFVLE